MSAIDAQQAHAKFVWQRQRVTINDADLTLVGVSNLSGSLVQIFERPLGSTALTHQRFFNLDEARQKYNELVKEISRGIAIHARDLKRNWDGGNGEIVDWSPESGMMGNYVDVSCRPELCDCERLGFPAK